MKRTFCTVCLALAVAGLCRAGGVESPPESHAARADAQSGPADATTRDPTVFIKGATMGVLTDVALAKLALARSKDTAIRSFADRILKDDRAIQVELAGIAKGKRLDVPTVLDGEDQTLVTEGTRKSRAQFDDWYIQTMIREQAKAVIVFQDATKGVDSDLARFAKTELPLLLEDQKAADVLPTAINQ